MMLLPRYANRFSRRERRQGRHLARHLRGPRQRTFHNVREAMLPIGGDAQGKLNAHNPYARSNWFRALAGNLCHQLGAEPPRFIPPEPVYFLTAIDRRQIINPDAQFDEPLSPTISEMRAAYGRLLTGLNFIGMLDPALYVSAQRTHGVTRFIQFHIHALVWGIEKKDLDAFCDDIRLTSDALLPYASSVKYAQVRAGDLLQVVWYTTKTPRSQYQVWRRQKGSLQQYKRAINGVNSVRLFAAMQDVTLDDLTLAGGAGMPVLKRTRKDAVRR
jgi:hypothetical protein